MLGTVDSNEMMLLKVILDKPLYQTWHCILGVSSLKWIGLNLSYLDEDSVAEWAVVFCESSKVSVYTPMGTGRVREHLCEEIKKFWKRAGPDSHAIARVWRVSWKNQRKEMCEKKGDVVSKTS